MPYHVSLDKAKEESLGDKKNWNYFKRYRCYYNDKVSRCGIRIGDLLYFDKFCEKLEANLEEKNKLLESYSYPTFNYEELVNKCSELANIIKSRIIDSVNRSK